MVHVTEESMSAPGLRGSNLRSLFKTHAFYNFDVSTEFHRAITPLKRKTKTERKFNIDVVNNVFRVTES